MTRADSWKRRSCVVRYFAYKDALNIEAKKYDWIPSNPLIVTFHIPMPKSWSEKKKREMSGKAHKQKPDIDNLLKGLLDCMLDEDSHIHHLKDVKKVWDNIGHIEVLYEE